MNMEEQKIQEKYMKEAIRQAKKAGKPEMCQSAV